MEQRKRPTTPPNAAKTHKTRPQDILGTPESQLGAPKTLPRCVPDAPHVHKRRLRSHLREYRGQKLKTSKTLVKHMVFDASGARKTRPRRCQDAPKAPEDAPKTPSTHPKTHPDGFQAASNAPACPKTLAKRTKAFPNKRASRLLLLRFLPEDKKVSKHIGFYRVFELSGFQKSAKKDSAKKWAPRGLQDAFWDPKSGPKRPPGGPKTAPRRPQEAPRRPQDAPRSPQDAPKRPTEGFQEAVH